MDIEEELRTHDDERLYEEADVLMSKGADEIARLSALCDKWNSECDEMREDNKRLAKELEAANAERDELLRGEFICKRCGLRKVSEHDSKPDF